MTNASDNHANRKNQVERVKAPIVGIIAGLAVVGGLGAWTSQRISEAKTNQAGVAEKRVEDSKRSAETAKAAPRVDVVQGVAAEWQPRIELNGTLDADQSARLAFRIPGKLSGIQVRVGDTVRAGQVLASLDGTEIHAQVAAADAQVRAASAQLDLAQDAERRTQTLVKSGATAEAAGVQTEKQRALAAAQLDAARAQYTLAKTNLGNHTLVAPFAGTISRAPSGVGSVVGPGEALFDLANTTLLKLAATVTESDASLLAVGGEVQLETESGETTGKIRAVLSTLDPATRRVPVQAEFKNPGGLRAGSFVRAWVNGRNRIAVVRVPHSVLRPGSQDEVLVVNPANSTIESRQVTYSTDKDGSLLVRRGIVQGDTLVDNPNAEAKTGDVVQVNRGEAK
jgi:RND family efflux transporter MFP subunit